MVSAYGNGYRVWIDTTLNALLSAFPVKYLWDVGLRHICIVTVFKFKIYFLHLPPKITRKTSDFSSSCIKPISEWDRLRDRHTCGIMVIYSNNVSVQVSAHSPFSAWQLPLLCVWQTECFGGSLLGQGSEKILWSFCQEQEVDYALCVLVQRLVSTKQNSL